MRNSREVQEKIVFSIGTIVPSGPKNGVVRSFAAELNTLQDLEERCNIRYDVLLALRQHYDIQRAALPKGKEKRQWQDDQRKSFGILGPCVLRSCSMFDVGRSFMADSLHNVYTGAFVSSSVHLKAYSRASSDDGHII